jgi:hypothetical protein
MTLIQSSDDPMPPSLSLNRIDEDDEVVEVEEGIANDDEETLARPYDPRLIRVEPKMFSLRNIMDMIDDEEVDLAPDFQRLRVWTPKQKSRLIESILLRIPLPAFYFASDDEGTLQVVDGVQRLSTIYDFVRSANSFPLVNLEYLTDEVGGRRIGDMSATIWAKRINNTQIVANVIDPQTPLRVKFDIFKRINTGGTPLNSQEIRHCMSGDLSRKLLVSLTHLEEFNIATGGKLAGHVRMADREMVLRVLAFSLRGIDAFLKSEGLDDFLNSTVQFLDRNLTPERTVGVTNKFRRAMQLAFDIFGERAFRKWPIGDSKRYPINRAIFEALGATLYTTPDDELDDFDEICEGFRDLCTNDVAFLATVTQSTAAPSNVLDRFEKIKEVVSR